MYDLPATNSIGTDPPHRHTAEWGLAALLMGSALAILGMITLLFNIFLGTMAGQIMGQSDVELALVGSRILAD